MPKLPKNPKLVSDRGLRRAITCKMEIAPALAEFAKNSVVVQVDAVDFMDAVDLSK
jgi:hypothetical protein